MRLKKIVLFTALVGLSPQLYSMQWLQTQYNKLQRELNRLERSNPKSYNALKHGSIIMLSGLAALKGTAWLLDEPVKKTAIGAAICTVPYVLSYISTGINSYISNKLHESVNKLGSRTYENFGGVPKTRFSDLVGKTPPELLLVKDQILRHAEYKRARVPISKGILMYGPPGCGKTSWARALAGECNAAFFAAGGSEFIKLYVGSGPRNVSELFKSAREAVESGKHNLAIIFIDEIDAIGSRSKGQEGHQEYHNTIDQLLKEMDGFKENDNIFVVAATNRLDLLDDAIKRPGRFDRIVAIPLPDIDDRIDILRHYISEQNWVDSELNVAPIKEAKLDDIRSTLGMLATQLQQMSNPQCENIVTDLVPCVNEFFRKLNNNTIAGELEAIADRIEALKEVPEAAGMAQSLRDEIKKLEQVNDRAKGVISNLVTLAEQTDDSYSGAELAAVVKDVVHNAIFFKKRTLTMQDFTKAIKIMNAKKTANNNTHQQFRQAQRLLQGEANPVPVPGAAGAPAAPRNELQEIVRLTNQNQGLILSLLQRQLQLQAAPQAVVPNPAQPPLRRAASCPDLKVLNRGAPAPASAPEPKQAVH